MNKDYKFWLPLVTPIILKAIDYFIVFGTKWSDVVNWIWIVSWFILFIIVLWQRKKVKLANNLLSNSSYIHNAIHSYRDELSGAKSIDYFYSSSKQEIEDHFNKLFKKLLNIMKNYFTKILRAECITTLCFIHKKGDDSYFETELYSDNASRERQKNSRPIAITDGLAGQVYSTENVEYVNNTSHETFSKVRDNADKFYSSCMSAPIKVDDEVFGLLNIDSLDKDIFTDDFKEYMAFFTDIFSAVSQMYNMARTINKNFEAD